MKITAEFDLKNDLNGSYNYAILYSLFLENLIEMYKPIIKVINCIFTKEDP